MSSYPRWFPLWSLRVLTTCITPPGNCIAGVNQAKRRKRVVRPVEATGSTEGRTPSVLLKESLEADTDTCMLPSHKTRLRSSRCLGDPSFRSHLWSGGRVLASPSRTLRFARAGRARPRGVSAGKTRSAVPVVLEPIGPRVAQRGKLKQRRKQKRAIETETSWSPPRVNTGECAYRSMAARPCIPRMNEISPP